MYVCLKRTSIKGNLKSIVPKLNELSILRMLAKLPHQGIHRSTKDVYSITAIIQHFTGLGYSESISEEAIHWVQMTKLKI